MNIAICEDNAGERGAISAYIEKYCEKNCYWHNIRTFANGEELLTAFSPEAFHVIFMDVYMPGMTGVEAARKIRETDLGCALVFITTSEGHALDAFSVRADTYVIKPLDNKKMDKALDICRKIFEKNSRLIKAPVEGQGYVDIPLCRVQYVEVYNKRSLFHIHENVIETRMPLSEFEDQLGEFPFLRCYRSYIVNMNYVDAVGNQAFVMQNGDSVPISRDRRSEIKLDYARFLAWSDIGGGQP